MSIAHLLNRTVTVFKPGAAENADGSIDRTQVESVVGAKARLRPVSARESRTGPSMDVAITHVIYFEMGIDLQPGYQIQDLDTGLWYGVLGVRTPSEPHHLEVDATLIQARQD